MKCFFKTILFLLLAGPVFAQTPREPSIQDLQRQMLEMQRQMLQQLQEFSPDNLGFSMPQFQWDTTFSFSFDTLINGGSGSTRFFFSPFGSDSTFMRHFDDTDPFQDDFSPFGQRFQWPLPPQSGFPENDENSALDDPGDGLLPEERLRNEGGDGANAPKKPTPVAPNKSKIKTIRI
jgi:hypothetical protein